MPNSDPTVTFRELTEISDLVVTGELSLQETGQIVTSTDTGSQRVTITAAEADRITFYSGLVAESEAAYIQTMDLGGFPALVLAHPNAVYGSAFRVGTLHVCADAGANGGIHLGHDVSYPAEDNTHDLGTAALSFKDLYLSGTVKGAGVVPSTYAANLSILTGTTQPSVGTGANARQMGLYSRMGSQVQAHVTVQWSSNGSAGNGVYTVSPPKTIHSSIIVGGSIGSGRVYDNSGTDTWLVDCRKAASTKVSMRISSLGISNVTNANPFACGSSDDQFDLHLSYLTTQA